MPRQFSAAQTARIAELPIAASAISDGAVTPAKLSAEYAPATSLDAANAQIALLIGRVESLESAAPQALSVESFEWPLDDDTASLASAPIGDIVVFHDGVLSPDGYASDGNSVEFSSPQANGVSTTIVYLPEP